MSGYLSVVVYLGFIIGFAVISLGAAAVLSPHRPNVGSKSHTYECGAEPVGTAWVQFPVGFYLVAMIFVIFDIEIVFLYPWAVSYDQLGLFALIEMVVFMLTVFVAYAYVWRRGGLTWD